MCKKCLKVKPCGGIYHNAGLFQLLYVLNVCGKSKEEEGEPSNQLQKVGIEQKKSRGCAHLIPLVVSKHCVCCHM